MMVGGHFHIEQPQGSEMFERKSMKDIAEGTLISMFDMCQVGGLKMPVGNNYLRKRTVVQTTSRELHETLDARYNHQPIEGTIRYLGRRINLSEFAARYPRGFAKNVCWFFWRSRGSGKLSVAVDDYCLGTDVDSKQLAFAADVKHRRLTLTLRQNSSSKTQDSDLARRTPRG